MRDTKLVTISGGTGGRVLLEGISDTDYEITSVFSPFDSGGSAGALREEFGGVSWGDVRRGLLALAPEEEPHRTLRELVEEEFPQNTSLNGHNFGSLFLALLSRTEGSDRKALDRAHTIFGLPESRRVLPSTFEPSTFSIELDNGDVIEGGRQIARFLEDTGISDLFLDPPAEAEPEVTDAIEEADFVTVGPGALYNSLVPALLPDGIRESLANSGAEIIYIGNSVTERYQTEGMKASDFVGEISDYLGRTPDHAVFNRERHDGRTRTDNHMDYVEVDEEGVREIDVNPVVEYLLHPEYRDRYAPEKLREVLRGIME